jgi:hypothetical protein
MRSLPHDRRVCRPGNANILRGWLFGGLLLLLVHDGICADAAPAPPQPPAPTAPAMPAGPGLDLIQRSCVSCHDIYMIVGKRRAPRDWGDIVSRMADRGAEVTPEELHVIEEYLVTNFSSSAPH